MSLIGIVKVDNYYSQESPMGIRPVPENFSVSQGFYADLTSFNVGLGHGAMDFAVPVGTKVVATSPGTILHADWVWNLPSTSWEDRWYLIRPAENDTRSGGGIAVVVLHDDGYITTNAHLSKTDRNAGDRVEAGEVIGLSGNTGSSTGPHLHFSVIPLPANWSNGYFGGVDPTPYITGKYFELQPYTKPDFSGSTMDGIDVSAYQPANIVSKVKADFVIVKATEGTTWVNPHLNQQVTEAFKRGKRVGVYHFATALADSDAEADHFMKHAKPYLDKGAMPVLDWEPIGLSHYTQWAEDWCQRVETKRGLTPEKLMVYMNLSVSGQATWSPYMKRHPLWLAFYGNDAPFNGYGTTFTPPKTPGWKMAMWQYTQHGTLPGHVGNLDLNVAFGDPWSLPTGTGSTVLYNVLEEIMAFYANKSDFEKAVAKAVWSYTNPKVTKKDAYAHLLQLPADILGKKFKLAGRFTGRESNVASTLAYVGTEQHDALDEIQELRRDVQNLTDALGTLLETLNPTPPTENGETS